VICGSIVLFCERLLHRPRLAIITLNLKGFAIALEEIALFLTVALDGSLPSLMPVRKKTFQDS